MTEPAIGAERTTYPPVSSMYSTPSAAGRSAGDYVSAICQGALIGGCAIAAAWAITEKSGAARASTLFGIATYVAIVGAVYAAVVCSWSDFLDRLWSRALERAAIGAWVGLAAGAISGTLAWLLYDSLQQITTDPSGGRSYLLRMLAWAVFGAGIGMAPGLAQRAPRKIQNGVIGGVIGGALGGAVQHWASFEVAAESDARLLGLVAIGVSVGAAVGLVEIARREAWVRVITGRMKGKQFILYHRETYIGSSPKAQITLIKDRDARPLHAKIVDTDRVRTVVAVDGDIAVNGRITASRRLRTGYRITLGATTLEYSERTISS